MRGVDPGVDAAAPQQVCPVVQCASVRQPVTQVLPMQCVDAGQCASVRQPTH
ncbi:MAG: hypothetical protein IPF99_00930 [Deltaproteobacteria bacterium]|nr:hypothetical protein [Deltaproteobacteria bacterium]